MGGLLNAPDYSYDKSRNQYVYHGHEDVENHVLHNPPSTWHSVYKRVLRQKELSICTVQRYCNTRTAMVAAVVAAQCKPQQSPVPLRRSPRKRRPSRVMIEAVEFSARNEPLPSIDESNRTSEEGDTREIDVGTEQLIASKGSMKDCATVRSGDHNLASPDGEEPLIDDIDVGEDATPEPNPSRTQQDIPDVSRDARRDVDLGSMTAQKWSQEQLQEPVCKSAMTLLQQGLGGASRYDVILQFPIRVRPTVQQVLELAAKTKLFTTEGNFPLLVKRNTSSAELSHSGSRVPQIYVPMLLRQWVLRGCHADSVCHFGVIRTQQMLQRFYWWVGLGQSVRWWIRRCLYCQARKTSRQTIRWPTTLMPLPSGSGQIVSVDYFGPLPITRNGNKHILLYTDRFSRHTAAYAVTQDERTAEGTARIFVEQNIPYWGRPHTLLSDNRSEFVARLSLAIYKLMRIRKITTTAFHPKSNGGVERVNHSLAQMLSQVISEQQDDWDECLSYVVQAYNNSISAAKRLAPNEIHLGRMPRLLMVIIDECIVKGHACEKQDQLLYLDIVRERQHRAFELVQESHLIAMPKIQRSNTKLLAILHKLPNFEVGNWLWIYNPQATVGQVVSEDNSHLVTKLSLNWTGPYKILEMGPGLGPDGRPVADKTLYLYFPTDMPGQDQKKRVSVDRCKMCNNPSDDSDIPKYLPAGLSKYVLHSFTDKSPPFHPTTEEVVKSGTPVDIEKITGHQLVRDGAVS